LTYVLPLPDKTEDTVIRAFQQVEESDLAKRRVEERSDEIDTLRTYREGDDIRRIHWQVSSRMNEFVVKQYEAPLAIETHVLFDDFTGYSLVNDVVACDDALTRRDHILDHVSGAIIWLLEHEMPASFHTYSADSLNERITITNEPLRYRRLLAMLEPDTSPTLGESIERIRGYASRDRYLLFSSRISEETAAAIIALQRRAYQVIYFHFRQESQSREEDNALRMLRRAEIEVYEVAARRTGSGVNGFKSEGRKHA
jgi:uncharacterized protein (DUF58 family)